MASTSPSSATATNLVAGLDGQCRFHRLRVCPRPPDRNDPAGQRRPQRQPDRVAAIGGASFSMSADGQVIAFPGGYYRQQRPVLDEIYAYSMATGTTQLVSVNAAGAVADVSPSQVDAAPTAGRRGRQRQRPLRRLFMSRPTTSPRARSTACREPVRAQPRRPAPPRSSAPTGRDRRRRPLLPRIAAVRRQQLRFQRRRQHGRLRQRPVRPRRRRGLSRPQTSSSSRLAPRRRPPARSAAWFTTTPTAAASSSRATPAWPAGRSTSTWPAPASSPPAIRRPTTDASGNYTFTNLAPGTYTVGEVVQAGYTQTAPPAPGTASVVVVAGQTATGPNFGDEPLPPDLTVQSISVPATAEPGQPASPLSYTVVNNGGGAAAGDWQDAVYLSTETTIDATATLLAVLPQTGGLAPGASYTQSLTGIPLPILPAGNEYLLVQVDRRGQVPEPAANKAAEFAASTTPIAFTIPTLTVGTPAIGVVHRRGSGPALPGDGRRRREPAADASRARPPRAPCRSRLSSAPCPLPVRPARSVRRISLRTSSSHRADAGGHLLHRRPQPVRRRGGRRLHADGDDTGPGAARQLTGRGGQRRQRHDRDRRHWASRPRRRSRSSGPNGPIAAQATQFVDGSKVFATFNLTGQPVGSYGIQASASGGTDREPDQPR